MHLFIYQVVNEKHLGRFSYAGVLKQLDRFKLRFIKKTNGEGIISSQRYFAPAKELIAGYALDCQLLCWISNVTECS